MTVTLEIAPELVASLRAMAQKVGMDPDRYIARALQEHVQRHQSEPDRVPQEEARLLHEISQGLPTTTWERYHELMAKRRAETLTPDEYQELIALTNEIEMWHARRIELVVALARQRQVPFDALMEELGLKIPADA